MNILLTGASRGLGLEICKELLGRGHTVYAAARTRSDEFDELSEAHAGRLFFKAADFSDPLAAKEAIFSEGFVTNGVPLSGLVNNAACAYDDIATNIDLARLEDMFKVNVHSPMVLTKYAIRNMIFNRTGGSLVHISSVSVHTGYKGLSMYAASKGALEAFSKNIAREWGGRGIRSNAVAPGFMETQMSSPLPEADRARIYARGALGVPTSLQSVASLATFLLSDAAASITGQSIRADAGAF